MKTKFSLLIPLTLSLTLVIGCATGQKLSDEESAKKAYDRAMTLKKNMHYDLAVEKFNYVKNTFPLTQWATKAELEIGEVHFGNDDFVEAIGAYELFQELHPNHPEIPYVRHRIGISHFKLIPRTIDRDLTPARKAVATFQSLIQDFPQSPHVEEAKKMIATCEGKLAEKELYIAEFYLKRDMTHPAKRRLKDLIETYPGTEAGERGYIVLATTLLDEGEGGQARTYLNKFLKQYPSSQFESEAKALLEKMR